MPLLIDLPEPFLQPPGCLRATLPIRAPAARPKAPAKSSGHEENDLYASLIPGLPDDVAKLAIALVPRIELPVVGAVSRRWRAFIRSKEFVAVRHEAGTLEECVYVLTGDGDAEGKGTRWELLGSSLGCNSHRAVPPMPGRPKSGFGVSVIAGTLMVIAGYAVDDDGKECISDEVYQYDARLNRWVTLAAMNVARYDFACAELNGHIYAVGGFGADGDCLSSAEVYDPETDKWTLIDGPRRPRWGGFGCGLAGELYVMGGRSRFTIGNSRSVDVYSPGLQRWSETKSGCVMVTTHAELGGRVYCVEWKDQRSLAVFDPAAATWQKVPLPLAGSSAISVRLGVLGGKLLVFPARAEPGFQTLVFDPEAAEGEEWQTSQLTPLELCLCAVTIEV